VFDRLTVLDNVALASRFALPEKVPAHVDAERPDLVAKLTVSDILAMAEEV
jgi:hypothetical protein